MQKRLIELHHERGRLLERIATQRHTLAHQAVPLAGVFRWGDRFQETLRSGKAFAQQYPLAVGAVAAVILVLKPGFVLRWAGRGMGVWRTWKSLQNMLPEGLLGRLLKSV